MTPNPEDVLSFFLIRLPPQPNRNFRVIFHRISLRRIPLGMHRSVEKRYPPSSHPVRDATLGGIPTECRTILTVFSTKRNIPNGMFFKEVVAEVYCAASR